MKLWKARSLTYKTHFFSALCRSLFTNSCWIFATSLFIKVVGSKGYSQLFFFASLTSLSYYIYFAFRGHKDKEPYNVYKAVLVMALIAAVGCFLEPIYGPLKPYNELLLYFFVVSVMTVDLIGTTLGPMVLQSSVNPAIFRQVYQSIITQELVARITAAALVWCLSQTHQLSWLYPLAWTMLIAHYVLFDVTIWRMRISEIKSRVPPDKKQPAILALGDSVRFVFANPLVRAAMIAMAWATVTKFILENLFYQVADMQFSSARQIAGFVSAMTITMYLLSLLLHHIINATMNKRMQLSALLSVQPINILIFGAAALIMPPFWPMATLMVTYNIIHRSIQLPMSRQCLVPVPRQKRATIVSLISIVVSLAALITSGSLAALKSSLHMQHFLAILLLLGGSIFFVITSLDSYYIRNLWSFFKEGRSGSWKDEPQLEGLAPVGLPAESAIEDAPASADIQTNPILNAYAFSFDRSVLETASAAHRNLLGARQPENLIAGLRVCYAADFPWFEQAIAQAAEHDNSDVRQFARAANNINNDFSDMAGYSAVFRRKIKSIAFELAESEHEKQKVHDLKNLLHCADHAGAEAFVNALADTRFRNMRELLLSCISNGGKKLAVQPIIDRMYENDFASAAIYRQLLEKLPYCKQDSDIRAAIQSHLATLKRIQLLLGNESEDASPSTSAKADASTAASTPEGDGKDVKKLQIFMHTLFLEEYRLSQGEMDGALKDTIAEFPVLSPDESGVLIDMHLSFLKRSDLFDSWQLLLT